MRPSPFRRRIAQRNLSHIHAPQLSRSWIRHQRSQISAASGAKAGTYSATVSATSGTSKQQIPLSVTCTSAAARASEDAPGPRGHFKR